MITEKTLLKQINNNNLQITQIKKTVENFNQLTKQLKWKK